MTQVEQELSQLKLLIIDVFSKIEKRLISLENRVISLEYGSQHTLSTYSASSTLATTNAMKNQHRDLSFHHAEDSSESYPEVTLRPKLRRAPKLQIKGELLKCVQCYLKYQEEENIECSCIYHPGELKFVTEKKYVLTCCQVPVKSRRQIRKIPGCTKAKHHNTHHTVFPYVHYCSHMVDMMMDAAEVWLTADLLDPVTGCCEWGEVGLSSEGLLFVVVGYSREQPVGYAELSLQELRECKSRQTELVSKKDPSASWEISVTLQAAQGIAKYLIISLKAASFKCALVKRLQLLVDGGTVRPGSVDTLSDPTPRPSKRMYRLPADVMKGPVLKPGQDHTVGRRSNYSTERKNEDFPLTLTQMESIAVDSSHIRQSDETWNNLFTTTIMVNNTADIDTHISDVYMQFQKDEQWIKCNQTWVATNRKLLSESERKNYSIAPRKDLTLFLRAAIAVEGALPASVEEGKRAHFTLPQPLHLRAVFVGKDELTASLRMEQGNPPLQLVSRKMREASWNDTKPMAFYVFADDVTSLRRTDAAVYFNSEGMLVYRVCPYGMEGGSVLLTKSLLASAAHSAKKHNHTEEELVSLKREVYKSSVRVFALVDLKLEIPFALKVCVTTPTSHSIGYFELPKDDFSFSSLTVKPDTVHVNSSAFLTWSVPRASSHDTFSIYPEYGSYSLLEVINDQAALTGTKQIHVPGTPGQYEVRYYPAWLSAPNSTRQHSAYTLCTPFTVLA